MRSGSGLLIGKVSSTVGSLFMLAMLATGNVSFADNADHGRASADVSGCVCPCWADPVCDGVRSDILDVIEIMNVAFRGCAPTVDLDCPASREDVNNDAIVDVLDVTASVFVAFRCGAVPTFFDDPCNTPALMAEASPQIPQSEAQSSSVSIANSVTIESKSVPLNATGVEIGIFISNDVPINGLLLPLEVRETVTGAYITGSFSFDIVSGSRVHASPLGPVAGSNWPAAFRQRTYYATPLANTCSGPISSTWCNSAPAVDFVSPDATLYVGLSNGAPSIGEDANLAPGSDPAGTANASFKMVFDVTGVPGCIIIDTCCVSPANHLAFISQATPAICDGPALITPAFTPGCVTITAPLDCADNTTTYPDFLVTCPKGDEPFYVDLKDAAGDPIEGYTGVTLDFSACPGGTLIPVPGEHPGWPIVQPLGPSDENGRIQFNVFAGGDCADCDVTINSLCGFTTVVPVHSVDVNGDLCVSHPEDFANSEGLCRDHDNSSSITTADYLVYVDHKGHCAPLGPCDNISIGLAVLPEGPILQGDQVTINWEISNVDQFGVCNITSIEFYHYDCASSATLNEVAESIIGQLLLPGATLSGQVTYTNPDALDFCLEARVYSNCCPAYASQILPMTVRNFCSIGDACVAFYCSPLDIVSIDFYDDQLLAEGWTYDVQVLNVDPIGVVTQTLICTGPDPQFGQSATVVITHTGYGGEKSYVYKNEPSGGDVCGRMAECEMIPDSRVPDCVIDVLDVVCMINYIFQGGPEPCPLNNVDLTCDCVADVIDIVTIVGTAFRGQPPPAKCLPPCLVP